MGTRATVVIHHHDRDTAVSAAAAAFDRIASLDEVMSDYRPDSELSRLCDRAGTGPVPASQDLLRVLSTASIVSQRTNGLFDVRIGPCVALWRDSRQSGQFADPAALDSALARSRATMEVDARRGTVTLGDRGMRLDLGGIGKGYAAAAARDVLAQLGLGSCMVSIGGDVAVGDPPPGEDAWRIEIHSGDGSPGVLRLPPGHSVSTAGDFEQFVEVAGIRRSHIIDPRTGLGSPRRGTATVVGRDGALVDAVDDAIYLAGVSNAGAILSHFPGLMAFVEEIVESEGPSRLERFVSPELVLEPGDSNPILDPENIPPAGFEALFNGIDLANWQGLIDGPPLEAAMSERERADARRDADRSMREHWSVRDGVLAFDGRGASLQSSRSFRDFELFVDWRIQKGGDSGIYLRGVPQVQIWDHPAGSGGLYNNRSHPSTPPVKADRPVGEWNRFHIIMRGDRVRVRLNDVLVADDVVMENYWEPGRPVYAAGPIELQAHGNPLEFRNIFVREIPPMPVEADPDEHRMAWWREARFGMFIHWGLYAIPAGEWNGVSHGGVGEWIMYHLKIPAAEYMPLSRRFNPTRFDADAWAAMAADAGAKYVVITTKHHDGFSLFDSRHASFDVMDATPFGRDVMKELAQACARRGLRMGWYHSILDWTHPLAQSAETYPDYVKILRGQVTELLTGYGPIGVMWFDGEWDANWTNDMGKDLYALCRSIQPWTIVNNRVGKGRQGMAGLTAQGDFPGDFGTPEQEIPATGLADQDWESCMTMNDTWGYKSADANWKSAQTLIRMLVETTSKGGNFLLNVGPTAEGLIPDPSIERFAAIARWMKANQSSIHGAGASPFRRLPWGRCTSKPGRLYLHVFDWPSDGVLRIPGLLNTVTGAAALATGQALKPVRDADGWSIDIRQAPRDQASTVIVIEIEGSPAVVDRPLRPGPDGSITLLAVDALLAGNGLNIEQHGGEHNIGFWTDVGATARWPISGVAPGSYRVELTYACQPDTPGAEYDVVVGQQRVAGLVSSTGGWQTYVTADLGVLRVAQGEVVLDVAVVPRTKPGNAVMNLKSIRLSPVRE